MSVLETALRDLGDHLDDLDRYGGDYMRRYVAWVEAGSNNRSAPHEPRLHPDAAKLCRELALDAVMLDRRLVAA